MYESPHPPPVAKASDAPAHFLGIDWNGIDWTSWAVAIATIAIVAFIVLKGRNRPRRSGSPAGDGTDLTNAALLNDISWGPGHHSHTGSDAGHHGGFFDGGGGDAGGGGHH
jgi:hypothetical protein